MAICVEKNMRSPASPLEGENERWRPPIVLNDPKPNGYVISI